MFSGFDTIYIVYIGAAITGIMIAEAVYMLVSMNSDRRTAINRRMRLANENISQEQVLIQLRKERGTGNRRFSALSLDRLRDLRAQSGLRLELSKFLAVTTGAAVAMTGVLLYLGLPISLALLVFPAIWFALPYGILTFLRSRRHKIFGVQLPEALELITRGLKAGHPVPVAIAMVAREMPDPIGSEFGMVADEVTYGSDMVSALQNMYVRVGHEDLPLFVTAVSIQSSSGGNLREILDGLARTIRERGKLRRKIRSISTEGRMSAYILTAVPVLLACAMMILVPQMYLDVKDEPMTWYLLAGTMVWLGIGNAMMFKMANFKF